MGAIGDDARFRVPDRPVDRRGTGPDRNTADRQRGFPKPNNSSVGMVIGPTGALRYLA